MQTSLTRILTDTICSTGWMDFIQIYRSTVTGSVFKMQCSKLIYFLIYFLNHLKVISDRLQHFFLSSSLGVISEHFQACFSEHPNTLTATLKQSNTLNSISFRRKRSQCNICWAYLLTHCGQNNSCAEFLWCHLFWSPMPGTEWRAATAGWYTWNTHMEGFNLLIRTIPEIHQLICHRPIKENTYYSEM